MGGIGITVRVFRTGSGDGCKNDTGVGTMLLNQETAGGQQRNDEDYNFPSDIYLMRLDDVQELPPKADDERKVPRLVFEFSVVEGPYKGKKCSTFVRKNLFPGSRGQGNASALYKLLKSLGVVDPAAGVETKDLLGQYWRVGVKNTNDRAWPESFYPATAPATRPPSQSGPPPRKTAPPAERRFWVPMGDETPLLNVAEIRNLIEKSQLTLDAEVCPEGGDEYKALVELLPELKDIIPF